VGIGRGRIAGVRISRRFSLRSRIILALARFDKARKKTHRASCFLRRARKSKPAKAAVAASGGQVWFGRETTYAGISARGGGTLTAGQPLWNAPVLQPQSRAAT